MIGPQFSRVNIKIQSQLKAIRVDFLPGSMHRMLRIHMHELFDGGFDALEFFNCGLKGINDELHHTTNMEDGKYIVEKFLLDQVTGLKELLAIRTRKRLRGTRGTLDYVIVLTTTYFVSASVLLS